jgi:hypothetical protein
MKKLLFSMMIFVLGILTTSAQVRMIRGSEVPGEMRDFISAHYRKYLVSRDVMYFVEYKNGKVEGYEVRFTNGTELEFDINRKLKAIECEGSDYIPRIILPAGIKYYLDHNYTKEFKVVKYEVETISKKNHRFNVKLNNGIDMKFDNKQRLINIEYDDRN